MNQSEKIQSINDVGWEGVNATNEPIRLVNRQAEKEINIQFKRCFDTEEGHAVLEHLRKSTLDQPAWVPGADPSFGYAREGQNSIVREIEQRIRKANEPDER
jgi:hypothetical protein